MRQSDMRSHTRSVKTYLTALVLLILGILTSTATQLPPPVDAMTHGVLIGNPAAVYCRDVMGYKYAIATDDDGGQRGLCTMPDGQVCDQWDFYAGACGRAHTYCARYGYETQSRADGQDPFAPVYAICVSPAGAPVGTVAHLTNLRERAAESCTATPTMADLPDLEALPPTPDQHTSVDTPTAFDWRDYNSYNWLTAVKNQAQCGSCWAFAAAGITEAHYNIIHNNPDLDLDLAEQQLVSCTDAGSCSGGSSTWAIYAMQDEGIVDEACLPYTASDSSCSLCADWQSRVTYVDAYTRFAPSRTTIQQNLVTYGPTVAYMGIGTDFGATFDGSGIYRCTDDSGTNHGVVIVGYDDAGSYWIVRNSWGSSWNGDGYVKVGYDECAIDSAYGGYTHAVPPTLASNVRPDGWSGPYTNDTTPSFQWDAASDSDAGMAGYYLAVDDWTPEGGSDDWWAAGVTTFTVPAPLAEGQHIFAVTSKDRFGNVNPENTNQAGDAPYTTFYVDTTPPASAVETLAAEQSNRTFTVRWSGSDATGDITKYDIQVRYGATGDWVSWLTGTTGTEGSYQANQDGVYYFRSRAYDQAGNVEAWPTGDGDTQTEVALDTDDVVVYLPLILSNTNQAPTTPSSPTPNDGATNRSTTTNLSWSGGDPDGDTVTYDVYVEANDATPDILVCDNATATTCDPGTLAYGTHYDWRVVATDEHGATTAGPTWDFTTESEPADFASEVVDLTNAERANAGCAPLTVNPLLTQAAEGHSEDMALNDFFSHTGSNGSSPGDRVSATGYSWSRVAENIAAGYTTPASVVAGWMNSSGHQANILNCALTEIGVGYYYLANDTGNETWRHYWTQVFATPW